MRKLPRLFGAALLISCTLAQAESLTVDPIGLQLKPRTFQFKAGGRSIFYSFVVGSEQQPSTLLLFYGGSGCRSWKSVMPSYVDGLTLPARIVVLNKRFVPDTPAASAGCSAKFNEANNPKRWISDYSEFIVAQLSSIQPKPKKVVLVGVSEGALVAAKVARVIPAITHLVIIGDGAWSMRHSLKELHRRGAFPLDVDEGWKQISTDPGSNNKQWAGNPYKWWADIMDIDSTPDYLALSIPILIGMGEKDESVPVESAIALKSVFETAGKSNLTLTIYPGADHRLRAGDQNYRKTFFNALSDSLQK